MTSQSDNGESKLQVGFGRFNLSTQGVSTIIVVVLLINMLLMIWIGRTIIQTVHQRFNELDRAADEQRMASKNAFDKLMCLHTLSNEDKQLFRQSPGNWGKWCWWVEEELKR